MMLSDRQQFTVVLRDEPGQQVSADVRLRQALKDRLRRWGFRCVAIEPAKSAEPQS